MIYLYTKKEKEQKDFSKKDLKNKYLLFSQSFAFLKGLKT